MNNDENKKICFVILPGFAISSMPVAPVEDYIRGQGYTVYSTNFWGEKKIGDFSGLDLDTCIEGIHDFIQWVKTQGDRKIIGLGVSLGGALYIEYAKRYDDLDYIVSIGTPFRLKNRKWISLGLVVLPILKYIRHKWSIIDSARMVVDFFEGSFLLDLEKVKTPVLFLHSKQDRITYFDAVAEYRPKMLNSVTHLVVFKDKDHVINYDAEIILANITGSIDFADMSFIPQQMQVQPENT